MARKCDRIARLAAGQHGQRPQAVLQPVGSLFSLQQCLMQCIAQQQGRRAEADRIMFRAIGRDGHGSGGQAPAQRPAGRIARAIGTRAQQRQILLRPQQKAKRYLHAA